MSRMTPRERVLTALAHRQPDRVPFSWGFGTTPEMGEVMKAHAAARGIDWMALRREVNDIGGCGPKYLGPELPELVDMWGIRWKEVSYGAGSYREVDVPPLAGFEDPEQLDSVPWPDPDNYDYAGLRAQTIDQVGDRYRAVKYFGGNPFEYYSWMTGIAEALTNLLVAPELVRAGMERVTGFFETRLRRTLEAVGDYVDLVFIADDLGGQNGLLMRLETYRELIKPYHRRLCDAVHELAPHAKIMYHSDGACFDALEDLLDAGIDMLEAVQTDADGMAPQRLKATFGDRLCFHGAISVQSLLPHGSEADVRAGCRELVQVLGDHGGYIAAPSHAIQIGTPPENVMAMLETVLGEDDYRQAIAAAAS